MGSTDHYHEDVTKTMVPHNLAKYIYPSED